MANLLRSVDFWKGVMASFSVVAALIWFVVVPRSKAVAETVAAEREKAAVCRTQLDDLQSGATVLYEWEGGAGIEVLGGLAEIRPGEKLGGQFAYGRQVDRWWIPLKVKPAVLGDARGRAYAWFYPERTTGSIAKLEGPFVPELVK